MRSFLVSCATFYLCWPAFLTCIRSPSLRSWHLLRRFLTCFESTLTVTKIMAFMLELSLGVRSPTMGLAETGAVQPAKLGSAAGKSSRTLLRTTTPIR
jgi:hypothetical protein